MPHVSVITPAYNAAKYLGTALDSVLSQTLPDWELIVVDDGSTDATPEVLSRYTDPRIVKIHQQNAGEAMARNAGLARATGEYVAFLDADDVYLPNALQDLSTFLTAHPEYGVALSDGYVCDEQGRILTKLSDHRPSIAFGEILEPLVLDSSVVTVPVCTMTRRSSIERYEIAFDRNLVIGPDWDFWIQLARHVQFGRLDKLTCMYRIHYSNITRTSGLQKRKADLVFGRLKVMNSDWFGGLSVATRRQFFYHLLIELLDNQPDRQKAILESDPCRNLPPREQADLWRQVGVDYVLRKSEPDWTINCFQEAVRLQPGDRKNYYLARMAQSGAGLAALPTVLRVWQSTRQIAHRLRTLGQRRPKPVPAGLGPVGN